MTGFPLDDRRSGDAFEDIARTGWAVIQDEVITIESILRQEIDFQRFEQFLFLILREIQQQFRNTLTVRSDGADLSFRGTHRELVEQIAMNEFEVEVRRLEIKHAEVVKAIHA